MSEPKKETWGEKAKRLSWPEFRDFVLDRNPLETVNLPWWKSEYLKLRTEEPTK